MSMSKKDNKWATGKPFSVEICDTLRFHVGAREVAENNRKNAFADRDAALDEIAELKDPKSPEYVQAKCNHSDAILRIDSLSNEIKWHNTQIGEIVASADKPQQLELSLEVPEAKPRKKDDGQLELGEGEKKPKPVGRPGPVRPDQPDPALAEGEDQHLAASVKELDCREDIKGKLIKAGLDTVLKLARVLNGVDGLEALREHANLSDDESTLAWNAYTAFKLSHRKAMRDADSNEPSAGGLKLVGTAAGSRPGKGAGARGAGAGKAADDTDDVDRRRKVPRARKA
jgi:hypothetical protein